MKMDIHSEFNGASYVKNAYVLPFAGDIDVMGAWRSRQLSTLVLVAVLLLLFYWVNDANCSAVHGNTTDRHSLLDFKEGITEDPTGALYSWSDNIHYYMWLGVNCSTRHPGPITVLDLYNLSLAGQTTPSLGNLTFLRSLDLGSNRFTGQLPPLGRPRKLRTLA